MDTLKHSDLKARKRQAAFSLVEIAMALGIVSFAFISVLGLLPVGLSTFRKAINASIGSQIVQKVINEAQQTDFNQLITDQSGQSIQPGSTGVKANRYFDEQGNELNTPAQSVYQVNTRITPSTVMPNNGGNAYLATVTIQIVNNPGNVNITSSANLWCDSRFSISNYSAFVARNQQ